MSTGGKKKSFRFFSEFQIHFRIVYNLCSVNNEQHAFQRR